MHIILIIIVLIGIVCFFIDLKSSNSRSNNTNSNASHASYSSNGSKNNRVYEISDEPLRDSLNTNVLKSEPHMELLGLASGKSLWRGYNYYRKSKVKSIKKNGPNKYVGSVEGSNNNIYDVSLDLSHPEKSTCSCPFALGTERMCKHKIAVYLTIYPEASALAIKYGIKQ